MNTTNSQVLPAPPSLMKALMAGFDAISNHIGLILFAVALDLLLWLGPRLSLARLVDSIFNRAVTLPELRTPEMAEMMSSSRVLWQYMAEQFNLFSVLRTFPVGIPSLMVSRSPVAGPGGSPSTIWELPSLGMAAGVWLLLVLAGLVAGTLYFEAVAQAALQGRVQWAQIVKDWPWATLQVLALALFWLTLLLGILVPFSCLLSLFLMGGLQIGSLAILLFGGLILWMFLPLIFSPHGIFANRRGMWASVRDGITMTRRTLPSTALFLMLILILSEGLDVLWRIPKETSWLAFVGVIGHAFVTTGLLASTFVYYRDSNHWIQRMLQQTKLGVMKSSRKT